MTDLDPDRVSADHAAALWRALDRVERLAAAGKTVLARRVADAHQPHRAGGARSPAEELARHAGTTVGAARNALDTSARLPDQPRLDAALRRGDVSAAQASLIGSAAAADPAAAQRLIDLAAHTSLPELRDECARVRAAADPDPQATNDRLHAARRLRRYTDPEGGWNLVARGTPQAGAAINAALDPLIDQLFTAARKAGRREPHDAYAFDALLQLASQATGHTPSPAPAHRQDNTPRGGGQDGESVDDGTAGPDRVGKDPDHPRTDPDHPRTPEHLRTDPYDPPSGPYDPGSDPAASPAVADPAVRQEDRQPVGRPVRTNPRYLALLRIDLEALRRGRVTGDELCEIAGVGPVPVPVARRLLGDAVLKLVITRGVDVLNVTHLGRGPTAAQKVALAWTSPGCTVEGCPRNRIEYDHREDYARTRHTRLDELDPLCDHHHDLKTRHNWALVPGTGKRPLVPPDDPRHPRHQRRQPTGRQPHAATDRAGPASDSVHRRSA